MNILSSIPIIGSIIDKAMGVVDQIIEDKDLANQIKAAVKRQMSAEDHEYELEIIKSQAGIVLAEAQGESWLQRNWRPILMISIVAIVVNNYILYPYLSIFTDKVQVLSLPDGLWSLMQIGVGGYIVGRTTEKGIERWKAPEIKK